MKIHPRSQATGQTLISQGEPMVWLSGGMFAIACSMIIALLGLILYKGLATHWQRPFAMYPLLNGEMEAGELQYEQPYNINRQAFSQLDAQSIAKAEAVLAGRDQAESTQLYLRTGNYDVTNRHFAFVPEVTINTAGSKSNSAYRPEEVWLLERREWGVLYGFPVRLEQKYAPELFAEYAKLKVLFDNLASLTAANGAPAAQSPAAQSPAEVGVELSDSLEKLATELRKNWGATLVGGPALVGGQPSSDLVHTVADPELLRSAVEASLSKQITIRAKIESAKRTLGRFDHRLSAARVEVRRAELRDETDLQAIADEATQTATGQGIAEAMWQDMADSLAIWKKRVPTTSKLPRSLEQFERQGKALHEAELVPFAESIAAIETQMDTIPTVSKRAVAALIATVRSVSKQQYSLNLEIARLEEQLRSDVVTFQVPMLDWIGELDWTASIETVGAADLAMVIGVDEEQLQANSVGLTALSPTQSLAVLDLKAGKKRLWLSVDASKKSIRVATLRETSVLVSDIVRLVEPNRLSLMGKLNLYAIRWLEFLFGQPREGGIEGGFFPAIWGTIVMTLIMSIAVMPFGVIAALYMREYAKSGWVLSMIRISINNLAGVPSIVYGVFGLAFFCYTIGGYIDGGPVKAGFTPWPTGRWFVALAVTAISGTAAFFLAAIASGSPAQSTPLRRRIASFGGLFWFLCLMGVVCLLAKSPFFDGFYEASLPNPTFGKGCLLWAACTLALLTLPVVIVATEEALAAVPNSLREGSYACGAGKWQTLQRIVLPYARPGIITGFILAMARGAGEVAPMMLVGAIPLVTELPLDSEFPFLHGSRSFMHLGFQIYSLGFQSQNSEAAKPMVFTAALLLLTIISLLNVTAIWLRARLRKRFQSSQF